MDIGGEFTTTVNDVVKNHITNDYEFLLFCNNDIKLLNNVVYGMLKIFKTTPKVGTVGCRLHFEDNTIQHDGVFAMVNKQTQLLLGHIGLGNYFNHSIGQKSVIGSTAALLMIKKHMFEQCGFFNEKYTTCFEDVELNIIVKSNGFKNFICGDCVAYHYESQTRNEDPENLKKLNLDYKENLLPMVLSNLQKIKNKIN